MVLATPMTMVGPPSAGTSLIGCTACFPPPVDGPSGAASWILKTTGPSRPAEKRFSKKSARLTACAATWVYLA